MQLLKYIFLSAYFYFLFFAFSALSIPLMIVLLLSMGPFISRRRFFRYFRRAIRFYGQVIVRLPFPFVKVCYEDMSNSNGESPYLFVCNHNSMSDPFLMSVLPNEAVQAVNVWPFSIPVLGRLARLAGYLNIKNMAYDELIDKSNSLLKEKVSIIFFPEGTRSGGRGIGKFYSGAFRLFLESKVPIIPLCIWGNEKIPPKGSMILNAGTIRVRSLPPFLWEEYRNLTAYAIKNRVRERIKNELAFMGKEG